MPGGWPEGGWAPLELTDALLLHDKVRMNMITALSNTLGSLVWILFFKKNKN